MAIDVKDLRGLTREELAQKVRDLKKELFHLRVQNATGRVESPARFKAVRRDVARVKTVVSEMSEKGSR